MLLLVDQLLRQLVIALRALMWLYGIHLLQWLLHGLPSCVMKVFYLLNFEINLLNSWKNDFLVLFCLAPSKKVSNRTKLEVGCSFWNKRRSPLPTVNLRWRSNQIYIKCIGSYK